MKATRITIIVAALTVSFMGVSVASAQGRPTNTGASDTTPEARAETARDMGRSAPSVGTSSGATSTKGSSDEQGNATSTAAKEKQDDVSRKDRPQGLSPLVHALLDLADREGGIGQEVREIASEHSSTTDAAEQAKRELAQEGGLKKFILGPDYATIGALRSTIVTTENHIARLLKARERLTSTTSIAAIDEQIKGLRDVASTSEAYARASESTFSVLGWFVRLFNR